MASDPLNKEIVESLKAADPKFMSRTFEDRTRLVDKVRVQLTGATRQQASDRRIAQQQADEIGPLYARFASSAGQTIQSLSNLTGREDDAFNRDESGMSALDHLSAGAGDNLRRDYGETAGTVLSVGADLAGAVGDPVFAGGGLAANAALRGTQIAAKTAQGGRAIARGAGAGTRVQGAAGRIGQGVVAGAAVDAPLGAATGYERTGTVSGAAQGAAIEAVGGAVIGGGFQATGEALGAVRKFISPSARDQTAMALKESRKIQADSGSKPDAALKAANKELKSLGDASLEKIGDNYGTKSVMNPTTGEAVIVPDLNWQEVERNVVLNALRVVGDVARSSGALPKLKRNIDYAVRPVVDRIKEISPRAAARTKRMFFEQGVDSVRDMTAVGHAFKGMDSLTPAERRQVGHLLSNGDREEFVAFTNGMKDQRVAKMLRVGLKEWDRKAPELLKRQQEVGIDISPRSNFFPRMVKPNKVNELRSRLSGEDKGEIDRLWMEARRNKAKVNKTSVDQIDLTQQERAAIIDRYLRGERPAGMGGVSQAKERRIPRLERDVYDEFYMDPMESLSRYIHKANSDIALRKIAGIKADDSVDATPTAIAKIIEREIAEGKIRPEDQDQLVSLLSIVMEPSGQANPAVQAVIDTTYSALLANPDAALIQIADVGPAAIRTSLPRVAQAAGQRARGRGRLDVSKDLGIMQISPDAPNDSSGLARGLFEFLAQFSPIAGSQKAARVAGRALTAQNLFRRSGFQPLDMFMKGTASDSAYRQMVASARSDDPRTRADLMRTLQETFDDPEEVQRALRDLRKDRVTRETSLLAYSALSDIQPLSKAQLPEMYLRMENGVPGSGRALYMLKTFTIRQAGFLRRAIFDKYSDAIRLQNEGNFKDAAKVFGEANLAAARTVGMMVGIGVPVRMARDWVRTGANELAASMGMESKDQPRDTPSPLSPEDISEYAMETILESMGMSRYQISLMQGGNLTEAASSFVGIFAGLRLLGDGLYDISTMLEVDTPYRERGFLNTRSIRNIPIIGGPIDKSIGEGVQRAKRSFYRERMMKRSELNDIIRGKEEGDVVEALDAWADARAEMWIADAEIVRRDLALGIPEAEIYRDMDNRWSRRDFDAMKAETMPSPYTASTLRSLAKSIAKEFSDQPERVQASIEKIEAMANRINEWNAPAPSLAPPQRD